MVGIGWTQTFVNHCLHGIFDPLFVEYFTSLVQLYQIKPFFLWGVASLNGVSSAQSVFLSLSSFHEEIKSDKRGRWRRMNARADVSTRHLSPERKRERGEVGDSPMERGQQGVIVFKRISMSIFLSSLQKKNFVKEDQWPKDARTHLRLSTASLCFCSNRLHSASSSHRLATNPSIPRRWTCRYW